MTCEGTGSCKQGRHPWCCDCGNLVTENSDGSSPHDDMRSGIDQVIKIAGWAILCTFVTAAAAILWIVGKLW